MATFDQLSDQQRAIIELVLRQGKDYAQLSDMLGVSEGRVRELARDALVELAPVSVRGVEEDWRGQLADYILGQQSGPEATATRGHLRRSEAARTWTRSLLDSLDQFYANGLPQIPEGERGAARERRRSEPARAAGPAAPRTPLTSEALAAVRRRRVIAGAGVAVLLLVAVLLWPVGLLVGDDDGGNSSASSSQAGNSNAPISTQTQGQAIIAEQGGKTQLLVTAQGLPPSGQNSAYAVWLYNSDQDRKSLGAQVTDAQGNLQAGAELPANYRKYKFIDITSVTVQNQGFQTGPSVMRGLLKLRAKPVTRGSGKNKVTLLGDIKLVPLPK
jgi:Sigma-70, region 4